MQQTTIVTGQIIGWHYHYLGITAELQASDNRLSVHLFYTTFGGVDHPTDLPAIESVKLGNRVRWDIYPYKSRNYNGFKLWNVYTMTQQEIVEAQRMRNAYDELLQLRRTSAIADQINKIANAYNDLHVSTKLHRLRVSSGGAQNRLNTVSPLQVRQASQPAVISSQASLAEMFFARLADCYP